MQRVCAVRAACWSVLSPDTLFTADETGIVAVWDATINRTRTVDLKAKYAASVMRASPHDTDTVAIGCKRGLVLVCNLSGVYLQISKLYCSSSLNSKLTYI